MGGLRYWGYIFSLMELVPLWKRTQRTPQPLPPCENTEKKIAIYKPGNGSSSDTESASILILNFPASRIMKNKFLLFLSNLVYGIFVMAAPKTKTLLLLPLSDNYWSIIFPILLLFPECHTNGIIQYITIWNWLLSPNTLIFLRFIHVIACISSPFHFMAE